MRKKINLRFMESIVLSPFILSIQPILQLFAINIEELVFRDVIRPSLIMLLLAVLLIGILFLILRDWIKAGLVASMFFPLFFGFGEIAKWVETTTGLTFLRSNALTLFVLSAWLFLWFLIVTRWAGGLNSINLYFNLISIVFLISPALQLADSLYQSAPSVKYESPSPNATANNNEQPDVYYIILDGYGRQDILQELYGFDNRSFTGWLKERGFYIAGESNSNYIQTALSMSSSLNMDYVQNMIAENAALENRLALVDTIHHSQVRRILAGQGYRLISFQNSYKVSIPDADIYYDDTDKGFGRPVTAFEGILINQSMMRILLSWPVFKNFFIEAPYEMHREQILSTYERLQKVPTLDGNYFVYAHIIAPHPPFVFGLDGEILPHEEPFSLDDANYFIRDHTRRGYISGYRRQIEYVNKLTMETIEQILSNSKIPPIIIIQGDHGPGAYLQWGSLDKSIPQERFGILNAYYFPGQNYQLLYPSISPVNSFRVILDEYFGQDFELLPEEHYFSTWGNPFDFIEVDKSELTPGTLP